MKQKEVILTHIEKITHDQLNSDSFNEIGANALDVSIDLKINRANVSKEMNKLWREGILIKIDGRPTNFVPLSVLNLEYPNIFIASYYTNFEEFFRIINRDQIDTEEIVTNGETNLNEQQNQLLMALSFPLSGYPPLIQIEDGINGYQFVYEVFQYLKQREVLDKNLNFKFIDCSNSQSHDFQTFFDQHINHVFTSSGPSAFYFIYNIHLLSETTLIKLNRYFINQRWIQSEKIRKDKYVIGLPANIDPSYVNTFSLVITTPLFTELSMLERLNTIINAFKNHAKKLNKTIRIQRELFKAFCINQVESNYLIIENDITTALIKSNFRSIQDNRSSCTLIWSDFSFPLIHESIPKHTSLNIIDSFFDDMIQFEANGTSKIDYIYNQHIINELNTLILKTDFSNQNDIKRMIERYSLRIKKSLNHELYALTIHSGYSKFNIERTLGNEKEIGFDFLTTQLNALNLTNFDPQYIEFIQEYYDQLFEQTEKIEIGILLIIDSRHHVETYQKILDLHKIPSYILSIRKPITIDELSKVMDNFNLETNVVIITDINIYQNIESLLLGVTHREVISYFPLSIPLLEDLIDKIEKRTNVLDLRKEKHRYTISEIERTTTFNDEENEFLTHLVDRFLIKQLTFLDAKKAVEALYPILGNILSELKLSHTKQFVVKFIVHSTFLIERCIKKEYLEYPNLNNHIKENGLTFNIIQKELIVIEEIFGITIPLSEIGYIVDIFSSS